MAERSARAGSRRPIAALALALVALLALVGCRNTARLPTGQVLTYEDQGREHLEPGDRRHPPYNSSPPTSGWHWEVHVPSRFMQSAIEPQVQVHELEHGAVIVQYSCENCGDLLNRLYRLQREEPLVIVAPAGPDVRGAVVLTAWTKMLVLDTWDEAKALEFIRANAGVDRGN